MSDTIDEDLLLRLYEEHRTGLQSLNQRMSALGFVGQFGDAEGEILYLLVRHARPEVVVEASPGRGWTSCYILNALVDNGQGELHSFDMDDASEALVPAHLKALRRFVKGDVRQKLWAVPGEIDFLLVDSEHSYDFAQWYLERLLPRLRARGVCMVHDVWDKEGRGAAGGRTEAGALLAHLAATSTPYLRIGHDCALLPRLRSARSQLRTEIGLRAFNLDDNPAIAFLQPATLSRVTSRPRGIVDPGP